MGKIITGIVFVVLFVWVLAYGAKRDNIASVKFDQCQHMFDSNALSVDDQQVFMINCMQ